MILLGLIGPAGAGKDTVAARLLDPHGFTLRAFADPIRAGLHAMLGTGGLVSNRDLRDPAMKEQKIPSIDRSPRELMQTLGTEWGRRLVHSELWIMAADRAINYAVDGFSDPAEARIVFTDVRFRNEAELIRRRGGVLVHIAGRAREGVNPHVSETELPLDMVDLTLDNSGPLEDLPGLVDGLVRRLIAPAEIVQALRTAEADVARLRAILTDTDRELREAWAKRILPASALSASLCQRIEAEAADGGAR